MDKSAVGHDYVGKTEKHVSQKDYAQGKAFVYVLFIMKKCYNITFIFPGNYRKNLIKMLLRSLHFLLMNQRTSRIQYTMVKKSNPRWPHSQT